MAGVTMQAPGRLDVCECERLHRCPNGTTSGEGSTSTYDCKKTSEVLMRFNAFANFVSNTPYDKNSHVSNVLIFMPGSPTSHWSHR